MSEWIGVAIAIVSSCLGGTAAAITRYLVGNADPITLAILRWGIGFLCVLPASLMLGVRWPKRADWPAVAALGLCFFGVFFVLYNIAIGYTTAARASLALATLPLSTMLVGALLGIERLTLRKSVGVAIAMFGVIAALAVGLAAAPSGAWRGELIMTGAVLCMSFYNVWSRTFIRRSSALGFLTVGMGAGAAGLVLAGSVTGQPGGARPANHAAMDRRLLFGGGRRRAGLRPVGIRAGTGDADPRRQHHDCQSGRGWAAFQRTRRRTHNPQPGCGPACSVCRHLDCHNGRQIVTAVARGCPSQGWVNTDQAQSSAAKPVSGRENAVLEPVQVRPKRRAGRR